MDYTVIGDGVNLAARLESACKQYAAEILVSEFTHQSLKSTYRAREVDRVVVKGKTKPVGIYEILEHHDQASFPNVADVLGQFKEGVEYYRAQNWQKAIAAFKVALVANEGDRLSEIYVKRCEHLKSHPPGDDWDGVWRMTSK